MGKNYLLVGSKKSDIVRRFLQYASSAKINLHLLNPSEEATQSRSSSETKRNDVILRRPQKHNLRAAAETIASRNIAGTKGVIWAVDAEFPASEYFRATKRPGGGDEIGDLKSLLQHMREKNISEFLWLTKRGKLSSLNLSRKEKKRNNSSDPSEAGQKTMADFIRSQKDINWTIISNGNEQEHEQQTANQPPIQTKATIHQEHDKTARAVTEILRVGGFPGAIIETANLPNNTNKIPRAIVNLKQSRIFLEITAPSRPSRKRFKKKIPSSTSTHNPLSSFTPPANYARLARPYENASPMSRLLSEIRAERVEGEHLSRLETLRLENDRRERAAKRYRTMKSNHEIKVQSLAQPSPVKSHFMGLSNTAEMVWSLAGAGVPITPSSSIQPTLVAEQVPDITTPIMTKGVENEAVEKAENTEEEEQGVLERLAEALATTTNSTDLSPSLSMAAGSTSSQSDQTGYHPRWQYTRWHTKRANRRR